MMRLLLGLLLVWSGLALAGEQPVWAGIPLTEVTALGLAEPDLHRLDSGWQAALPEGGFVRVDLYADVDEAKAVFARQRVAVASRPLPVISETEVGDGDEILLVRDANVLLLVRDPNGGASDTMTALRGALVRTADTAPAREARVEGQAVVWDSCGWRRVVVP